MKWLELFAGGGGVACGLEAAGHEVAAAIEKEAKIAECYRANHPDTLLQVADVQDVAANLAQLPSGINAVWMSPVCKQDSQARNKTLARREDADVGRAAIAYIEALDPDLIIIENVVGYRKNPALTSIIAALAKLRYSLSIRVIDAANYGVPQHRERLIVQARKGPIAWPEYAAAPQTWYSALEDLFTSMKADALAPWQQKLWKPDYNALVPLIVYGHYDFRDHSDDPKALDITTADQPARTVTSSHNNTHRRVVLADGRILRFSPRESARLQTFPDHYIWPAQVTLAQEIIGNAVPPLLVERLTEAYAS
jgi:DNA (cytosine-5)-methyltransferase 1